MRGYAICTTPRSGSSWLCRLLESTGVLGRPAEYFRTADQAGEGFDDYPTDPALQLERVLERGATDNGVYGVKICSWQLVIAQGADFADRLPDLEFVLLERADILGQAISLSRAWQTDRWEATMAERAAPAFDAGRIRGCLDEILDGQRAWREWFAGRGIAPRHLVYEDCLRHPFGAIGAIAALVDAEPGVRLEIQRDHVTQEWRERYVIEAGRAAQP